MSIWWITTEMKGGVKNNVAHAQPAASWRSHQRAGLDPLGLTVTAAAEGLGVSRRTLSALLNGHAGISPDMAIRLSKAFGRSPESWVQLQLQYDLWKPGNDPTRSR